jgi:hypothetical protein
VEEGIRNDAKSLQAEGMDYKVESIVSGTTGTSATIVQAPKQHTTPLQTHECDRPHSINEDIA